MKRTEALNITEALRSGRTVEIHHVPLAITLSFKDGIYVFYDIDVRDLTTDEYKFASEEDFINLLKNYDSKEVEFK